MNDREQFSAPMRKSRFQLFGIEGAFEAFTKDDHWNGWECPFFTRGRRFDVSRSMERTR
jgi:hypothetical protein